MTKSEHSERPPRHVKRAATRGLIELSVDESASRQRCSVFVVRLAGERCVEVPADFDGNALQRLLSVLSRC